MTEKLTPYYQDVDGFRIPGVFCPDAFRSGLTYKPKPEDLFLIAFPKSGSTWLQQIVALLHNNGEPAANFIDFNKRTLFLDMCGRESAENITRPASIKTHMPFHLAPYSKATKYICIVRNPKDVAVSFFHHTRSDLYRFEKGTFDDYFELFLNGQNDFGDQIDHVLSWYEHRNDDNVLFLTYEEMKRDTKNMVRKIAKFMGDKYGELVEDEEVLDKILSFSSFQHMKEVFNDTFPGSEGKQVTDEAPSELPSGLVNFMKRAEEYKVEKGDQFKLIRKGIIGDWRSTFSDDQNRRMNEKIEKKLKGTELYEYWKSIECI